MKTTNILGTELSALSLGTVQLGVDYGINNTSGKPDEGLAFRILDTARKRGVTALDTAGLYGDSEVIIGRWLKTLPESERPFVMTKGKHLDHSSLDALRKSMREEVESSKKRLGLDTIPLFMLHSCDEYLDDEENVKTVFRELKESGDIRFCGVSAYAHHDYFRIAESGFDAVQIPVNVFDFRQITNGGIQALVDSGMAVFARSVYLQGLVFKTPETLDPRMEFARGTLERFRSFCANYGLTPAELAVSFVLSLPGIVSLTLGSERPEQVEQNADLVERAPRLSEERINELKEAFSGVERRVLDPSMWFNA